MIYHPAFIPTYAERAEKVQVPLLELCRMEVQLRATSTIIHSKAVAFVAMWGHNDTTTALFSGANALNEKADIIKEWIKS